jgi:phosphoribosyl-ATP pyrophosphohydrolase/phosphoribosyl-AMP cyclohydrolase
VNDIINKIDWNKGDGLIPAIIQNSLTGSVLMLGYMNADAIIKTFETKKVTFFSRSKNRLWVKGETSGHFLNFENMTLDCDGDTLLVQVNPVGHTCHTGTQTCFGNVQPVGFMFLETLAQIIAQRAQADPTQSYIARLIQDGTLKMAQKVGEEGVEVALAATCETPEKLKEESADLLFHLMVLLHSKGINLVDIINVLRNRA